MVAKHLKDGADEDRPGKGKKEKKSSKNSTDKDKGQERKEPKEKSVEDKKSKKVKNKKKNKIFQRADLVWRWLQSLVWVGSLCHSRYLQANGGIQAAVLRCLVSWSSPLRSYVAASLNRERLKFKRKVME
jgi:hypothetical protein